MTEKESCSTASSSSPAEDTIDIRLNDNDDDDNKTSNVDSNQILKVCRGKHIKYIGGLASKLDNKSSYEGAVTEHLRMSGIYWTYAALSLLVSSTDADTILGVTKAKSRPSSSTATATTKASDDTSETNNSSTSSSINDSNSSSTSLSIVDWVLKCYDKSTGGFGGNIGHDGHLLYTLSAIQILCIAKPNDFTDLLDVDAIVKFVSSLQQSSTDGSFAGDKWGEIDTRFTYCALSILALLNRLDDVSSGVDIEKAVNYIISCQNIDGGFGSMLGGESHAGQVFCCVGALSITKSLHRIKSLDKLVWWLVERQCDSGGLNGRPEKQADVCYSWWILSVLKILNKVSYININKLAAFICKAQDVDDGGIADRPDDMPDIFHTFFGLAGLSLLGKLPSHYRTIDPVYALPTDIVIQHNLTSQIITTE